VRRSPEATAVVCAGKSLSYSELNRRADSLAHRLRLLGVGPDDLVGLSVERSVDMVVAILGILKAGGAYVPLDPAYPRERLAVMLTEAQPKVLVTEPHLTGQLPASQADCVCVDDLDDMTYPGSFGHAPDSSASRSKGRADDLAYVIFTSGSTGRPKGVIVSHRNVVRLFQATEPWYQFGPHDVWTMFHSYAFDFSVWELWGALLHGGRLVVVPQETSRSPRDLLALLRAERVTVLNQTPSAFRQLIQAEESSGAPKTSEGLGEHDGGDDLALRLVIFGGEALSLPTLRPWVERHGDQRPALVNMFGITETTVHVTYRPITRADVEAGSGSPIGRPIPGWHVHLLDENLQPVADGSVGEIYVGGDGVARGYLNRPDLTRERFLPSLFSDEPHARLYKSGDLARRLPDGDLVYVGRIDHQVKVRGFRIEPLEIEAALARHPKVREAAVLAREDVPGQKRLVAYVASRNGSPLSSADLRRFLMEKLPDYMVPAAFVFLDALPITTNGKVSRDRLPASAPERGEDQCQTVGPRNDTERTLQRIWQNLLRVHPVGMHDNFFELGGDSLLSMSLCAEVKKAFGHDLSPIALFQGATIEQLAATLERANAAAEWSPLVPIQPHGSRPPLFCVHPLGGQVLGYRLLARYLGRRGDEQPFYGLQGRLSQNAAETASIEYMASQYVAAVTGLQPRGPYYLSGYSLGAFIAFEMAQQLVRLGRQVAFLGVLDDGPALIHDPTRWTLGEMARFLANVPRWLRHQVRRKKASTLLLDIWRKLKVWTRRLLPCRKDPGRVDVEEALDVSAYSEAYRRALANNYGALKRYRCRPYPGRITVFRAQAQPLFGQHSPDLGWGARARQGVEVHVITGDHNSIVTEPDVRILGERLSSALMIAQEKAQGVLRQSA
jgi:amino acid adenylation domain-containing protein